jgi:hypothetical protein
MNNSEAEVLDQFPDDAEWRKTLPEVFRTVAQRYGKMKFSIAWNAGAAQEGLRHLADGFKNHKTVLPLVMQVATSANQLAAYAIEAAGMTYEDLREVQVDIERAATLATMDTRTPAGKIILPS